jgi:hypothetical protein
MGSTNIEIIRHFLKIANRQFEKEGIFIHRIIFRRDESGETSVELIYEEKEGNEENKNDDELKTTNANISNFHFINQQKRDNYGELQH